MIQRPTPLGGSIFSSARCFRPTLLRRGHCAPASLHGQRARFHRRLGQLLATENGLYIRDVADGRLTLHVPLEADNAATRSNDGRVHPCGALWIGTMGRKAEKGAGAIYRYHQGELAALCRGDHTERDLLLPDGATAYFTDSREGILYRVAIDPENALPIGDPAPLNDNSAGQAASTAPWSTARD